MATAAWKDDARPLPKLLFWLPILLLDAVFLAFLPRAHMAALGLLAAVGIAALLARPRIALAVAAVGLPLLDPVTLYFKNDHPVFFLGRAFLLLPLIGLLWERLWQSPRPEGGLLSQEGLSVRREPVFLWALALGLILALGYLWTPSPDYGSMKVKFYFAVNFLLLSAAIVQLRSRRGEPATAVRWGFEFLRVVLLLSLLVAAAGVWNYYTHFYKFRSRLLTLGINPILLARTMGLGLICLLALYTSRRIRLSRAAPLALILAWVFFQTGSRGPLLAIGCALLFWLAAAPGKRGSRFRAGLAVLFTGFLLVLLYYAQDETWDWLQLVGGREGSNSVRLRLLDLVGNIFAQVGFWGAGTGSFGHLIGVGDLRYYPHNIFFEVYLENGLPGMAALIGLLGSVAVVGWRARQACGREETPTGSIPGAAGGSNGSDRTGARNNALLVRTAGTLLVFSLVAAQTSGDIFANEWIWLWAGALVAWAPRPAPSTHGAA